MTNGPGCSKALLLVVDQNRHAPWSGDIKLFLGVVLQACQRQVRACFCSFVCDTSRVTPINKLNFERDCFVFRLSQLVSYATCEFNK